MTSLKLNLEYLLCVVFLALIIALIVVSKRRPKFPPPQPSCPRNGQGDRNSCIMPGHKTGESSSLIHGPISNQVMNYTFFQLIWLLHTRGIAVSQCFFSPFNESESHILHIPLTSFSNILASLRTLKLF